MADDGNRYELIDGELYVSAAPGFFHQPILANIIVAFADYLREYPIGRVAPGVGVIFDDNNGVIPDLVFATRERITRALAAGRFRAAPGDLALERNLTERDQLTSSLLPGFSVTVDTFFL